MTPLKNSFKSLLLKRIPALTREELDRYDNVFALTQELRLHASVTPWRENKKIIEKNMDRVLHNTYKILDPYWKQYKKLHKIWFTRQKFVQNRGSLLQIVSSWDRGKKWVSSYCIYQVVNVVNNLALFFMRPKKLTAEQRD